MLFKSLNYKLKSVDEKGIVQFYANSFGKKDGDGDIITKGAFKKSLSENFNRVKHLLNHEKSIGVPMEIVEDDFGLLVTSQLILGKQIGKEAFEEYKVYAELNRSMEHSIGFKTIKNHTDKSMNANVITEVALFDVTTMETWGANPATPQVSVKAAKEMVKCPSCGLVFDYNSVNQIGFDEYVLNEARYIIRWYTEDEIRAQLSSMKPEISTNVQAVLQAVAKAGEQKSLITDIFNIARCPQCGTMVSPLNAVKSEQKSLSESLETLTKFFEPGNPTQKNDNEPSSWGFLNTINLMLQ